MKAILPFALHNQSYFFVLFSRGLHQAYLTIQAIPVSLMNIPMVNMLTEALLPLCSRTTGTRGLQSLVRTCLHLLNSL